MSELVIPRSLPLNLFTGGRTTVGCLILFAPKLASKIYKIKTAGTPAVALGRMFGIRNLVLALGLLRLDWTKSPRTFLKINMVTDLVDAIALVAAGRRREMGTAATVMSAATALLAVGLGGAAVAALPEEIT